MAQLKITDPLARARKRTQELLAESRKPSAEELMGEAAIDIPEDAPEDYGEAGATPVLGDPEDTTLAAYSVPGTEGGRRSFSGRYGKRLVNAGPEDLTLASPISKVDADDPRLRNRGEAAPAPAPEPQETPAAGQAKFDYSKQQSWGDQYDSTYNYTYVPVENSTAGIIKVEKTDPTTGSTSTIVLDPRKPMSESNTRAYTAIMEQRFGMGDRPTALHAPQADRRQRAAENAMGVTGEAEAPVEEDRFGESLLEEDRFGEAASEAPTPRASPVDEMLDAYLLEQEYPETSMPAYVQAPEDTRSSFAKSWDRDPGRRELRQGAAAILGAPVSAAKAVGSALGSIDLGVEGAPEESPTASEQEVAALYGELVGAESALP